MFVSPVLKAKNLFRKQRNSGGSSLTKNSSSQNEEDDLLTLSTTSFRDEKTVMKDLQEFCLDSDIIYSQETIYRFAAFHNFDLERSKKAIRENQENYHLNLEMIGKLRRQAKTGTIFPLSGLQTRKDKMDVCYIQASRIDPDALEGSSASLVIKNLCYVLNDLSRTKDQCLRGVAVIINMKNYKKSNFSFDVWKHMMMVLQGDLVPTTVNLVLFVDSPKWFHNNVWKPKVKSMATSSFARRCRFIEGASLLMGGYFADGSAEGYLPTNIGGWKLEDEIVDDYLDLKDFEYEQRMLQE